MKHSKSVYKKVSRKEVKTLKHFNLGTLTQRKFNCPRADIINLVNSEKLVRKYWI